MTLSTSETQDLLALSGKDMQKRDLIIVYNFREMVKYRKVEIVAR